MAPNVCFPTMSARLEKAASILSLTQDEISKELERIFGITKDESGIQLLDADTTTEDFIVSSLNSETFAKVPLLKLKVFAAILKGRDPFKKEETPEPVSEPALSTTPGDFSTNLSSIVSSMRTPKQMKDRELLEAYLKDPDHEFEQELNRRAGGQTFVVLKDGYKQEIDVETTLDLLKRSRKMTIPSIIPHPQDPSKVVEVYRITQLNPDDNIVELCPFCDEVMYKGFCQHCNINFSGVGDEERAYVRLASQSESFNVSSISDRKALWIDSTKGLETLFQNWPGVRAKFKELKLLNNLPKLRKLRTLPSVKPADPFGVRSK